MRRTKPQPCCGLNGYCDEQMPADREEISYAGFFGLAEDVMKRRALLWVLLSASAFGQTLIYSNLNSDPTNVYDCCNGYQMSNPNQSAIAVPFVVPKGVHHFAHAVVAFQWTNYDGGGIWVLDSDDSGLPGPALTQVTWSALPEVDTCCV